MSGIVGLALYLIATGISFAVFTYVGTKTPPVRPGLTDTTGTDEQGHFVVDPSAPRTEACPINGKLYTKQEREAWEKHRPIAAMIENHEEARPQSGLAQADIVYEAVAEGGITRFMGIFYCGIAAKGANLAPVRSARTYFVSWVLEYDALYNHVGGAGVCSDVTVDERAKALCQIEQYKVKDLDQFGLPLKYAVKGGKKIYVCYRNPDRLDHEVATEHTMICNTDGLYAFAEDKYGWANVDTKGVSWDKNFQPWKFKDDAKSADRGTSFSASFAHWKGYEKSFGVKWDFDPATNTYKRTMAGEPHVDQETKVQLSAHNVVIQFAEEEGPVDSHAHLLYENIGSGDGLLFQDGKVKKVTWKKANRNARTIFYENGKEVSLNRGQTWIEMLPTGTKVSY